MTGAARRPVPLNELPRSVTHLSGARLEELNAHDVGDVLSSVSGLARTNLGMGRDKLLLRGISDGALTGRAQSTVGIYLNGLRLTYAAPDPDLPPLAGRDRTMMRESLETIGDPELRAIMERVMAREIARRRERENRKVPRK